MVIQHANSDLDLSRLIEDPREDLDCEYKSWVDAKDSVGKATIAQALLGLANHGGGYLVFGFREDGQHLTPQSDNVGLRTTVTQDSINSIVHRFSEPPFHCSVHYVSSSRTATPHPVVIVPPSLHVPCRAKRGGPDGKHVKKDTYYIRRPGPSSEPPQSGSEWDALIRRCIWSSQEDMLRKIQSIVIGVPSGEIETPANSQGCSSFETTVAEGHLTSLKCAKVFGISTVGGLPAS